MDPGNLTFSDTICGDLANAALSEVGRLAPSRFQQDITPDVTTLKYQLLSGVFGTPQPEIEVKRVELWDIISSPHKFGYLLAPVSSGLIDTSVAGWEVWGGYLYITGDMLTFADPTRWEIRVWGYAPYPPLTSDVTALPVSNELEQAMRTYAQLEGLKRLVASRDTFSQWQARSGNTDVSPAGLLNALSMAQVEWQRKARSITVLR